MSDFYNPTDRKARKPHKCYWCGETINAGDKYRAVAGFYGGEFYSRKECKKCADVLDEFYCQLEDSDFDADNVYEWWREEKCPKCMLYESDKRERYCKMTHYSRCENWEAE
jgi:hypothetical protein